jgi:hypothetical protein
MQVLSQSSSIKSLYVQKISKDELKKIKQELFENKNRYTFRSTSSIDNLHTKLSGWQQILKNSEDFQKFLYSNGIDGTNVKRVSELTFNPPAFLDIKA